MSRPEPSVPAAARPTRSADSPPEANPVRLDAALAIPDVARAVSREPVDEGNSAVSPLRACSLTEVACIDVDRRLVSDDIKDCVGGGGMLAFRGSGR